MRRLKQFCLMFFKGIFFVYARIGAVRFYTYNLFAVFTV